jgi:peptidyl-prolyl cis-trans isomerase SurA
MTPRKTRLFVLLLAAVAAVGLAQQVVEEIVAIVNDDVITLTQYKREYDLRLQSAQAQFKGEDLDKVIIQIKAGLLDGMITDILLLQLAKTDNLNVADQVKMALENIKKENNLETEDDLKRAVRAQGLEWEPFLKQVEESMMRQAIVYKEVNRSIVLDDAQIVDFYKKNTDKFVVPEEYKLRAVYFSTTEATAPALEAKKKAIDEKIKAGADFAELSGTESDTPVKENKGDLGTLKKAEMDKTLFAAVEPLKKGELSPWVTAKNGLYLLKLEDKKDSKQLSFEEARKQIEDRLFSEKQNVKLTQFLETIKKKSYIKIVKANPIGS